MMGSANIKVAMRQTIKLGALGLAMALSTTGRAQTIDADTLIDRAQIEDLLTRYYYNFGKAGAQSFGTFYSDDAEMILGKTSYKGRAAIEGAYKALAGADIPQRKSFSFNVLLTNPLVVVHGQTATARLIFTEIVVDKQGDAPRVLTQGKEFDRLVKSGGVWRIAKRQILGADQGPPADWTD